MQEGARSLEGQQAVALRDLMPPDFILASSDYASLGELFDAAPFTFNSTEKFKNLSTEDVDAFISLHTSYATWEQMNPAAVAEYARGRMGSKLGGPLRQGSDLGAELGCTLHPTCALRLIEPSRGINGLENAI